MIDTNETNFAHNLPLTDSWIKVFVRVLKTNQRLV